MGWLFAPYDPHFQGTMIRQRWVLLGPNPGFFRLEILFLVGRPEEGKEVLGVTRR